MLPWCLLCTALAAALVLADNPPPETDWFYHASRGVFTHYLNGLQNNKGPNSQGKSTSWTETVDEFDVEAYADSAVRAGARYAVITMMQGGIHMIAPNSVYDRYTGYSAGVACSRRDLVLDLYAALSSRGLKLLLYWTGDGPHMDHQASAGLGMPNCPSSPQSRCDCRMGCPDKPGDGVPALFAQRWGEVLAEYARRYGSKVSGWWIDGCYAPWYNQTGFPLQAKLKPYHDAIRSGNPAALIAFNNGVKHPIASQRYTMWEDFTCGESNDFTDLPISRSVEGAQWHTLGYLGAGWGKPGVNRYNASAMQDYSQAVAVGGGVLTVDVQLLRNGSMNFDQIELLRQAWS